MRRNKMLLVVVMALLMFSLAGCGQDSKKYLVLVDKYHEIPADWEESIELDTVQNSVGQEIMVEHETYEQFSKLRDALEKEGVKIDIEKAYRSREDVQKSYDVMYAGATEEAIRRFPTSRTKQEFQRDELMNFCVHEVCTYCGLDFMPGHSEHETGLVVDIYIEEGAQIFNWGFSETNAKKYYPRIHALMPEYGFILSHPEGKKDIIEYPYEPYHLRYIGDPKIAKEITEKGITLEEYLGEVPN